MTAQLSARFMEVRLGGAVLGLTAAIALFLSAVGLYGVVSFLVRQRAKEIGIRLAVGARPAEVVALLVRQGMRPIALGGALGVLVSLATAPLLSRWLFGVAPIDVATILFAVSLVAVVALIASWLPARRAARTDPALVFRCD
jgi:ABC-type antimicrobial peptide transport system permease subunit